MNLNKKTEAIKILQTYLIAQHNWVKVHSAEFLLWSGHSKGIKEIFLEEEKKIENESPYRIGVWRVLQQAETKTEEKEKWIQKILQAFSNENGKDRIHAAETLAKLKISPLKAYPDITQKTLNGDNKSLSLYTKWAISYSYKDSFIDIQNSLLELLLSEGEDLNIRCIAGYIIRQMRLLKTNQWILLAQSALSEPMDSDIRINLLNAAFVCADKAALRSDLFEHVYKEFLEYSNVSDNKMLIKLADGLSENGRPENIGLLSSLLKNNDSPIDFTSADLRAFASYAILKISNRWKLNWV